MLPCLALAKIISVHPRSYSPMPIAYVHGEAAVWKWPCIVEVFIRATMRVALDDTHESAENEPPV